MCVCVQHSVAGSSCCNCSAVSVRVAAHVHINRSYGSDRRVRRADAVPAGGPEEPAGGADGPQRRQSHSHTHTYLHLWFTGTPHRRNGFPRFLPVFERVMVDVPNWMVKL